MTTFSKVRRWLDGVDSKLKKDVAPSRNCSVTSLSNRSTFLGKSRFADSAGLSGTSTETSFSEDLDHKLVKHLLDLAGGVLTERQKHLLVSAFQELRWNSMTLTRLCDKLSNEMKMSYSTVKWNMRRLVKMKLLLGGTLDSKGAEAGLTRLGYLIVSALIQNASMRKGST